MWCPMTPDREWVTTIAPLSRSTSDARLCGVQVSAGDMSTGSHVPQVEPGSVTSCVRNQLLRTPASSRAGPAARRSDRSGARHDTGVDGVEREQWATRR